MINEARVRFRQGRPLITRTKNLSHLHYRSGLAQAPRVDGARTSSGNTGGGKGEWPGGVEGNKTQMVARSQQLKKEATEEGRKVQREEQRVEIPPKEDSARIPRRYPFPTHHRHTPLLSRAQQPKNTCHLSPPATLRPPLAPSSRRQRGHHPRQRHP